MIPVDGAAVDAFGNTVTGYTGTVNVQQHRPLATLPAAYTFTAADAGVHTFTARPAHGDRALAVLVGRAWRTPRPQPAWSTIPGFEVVERRRPRSSAINLPSSDHRRHGVLAQGDVSWTPVGTR